MRGLQARAILLLAAMAALAACLAGGCSYAVRRSLTSPSHADTLSARSSPYLKVHAKDGGLYVLRDWSVQSDSGLCYGTGELLDARRQIVRAGAFAIPLDSVALFETNRVESSSATAALTVLTVLSAAVSIYCIANPKSCFGSCPTFYVSDGTKPVLQAEGFSASVAPSLEARDIDALPRARPVGRELEVVVTNEALETHVIRHADILAVRRPPGGRVVATSDGTFREALASCAPSRAVGPEGDCLEPLRRLDGVERFSKADSTDLSSRETLELEFPDAGEADLGLVLASRQSLMTTYLYYQALAYMGRSAGDWLAALERGNESLRRRSGDIGRALGGIEVWIYDRHRRWVCAGEDRETGPIATDVRLVPLPKPAAGPVRIRLRLARGAWRLDQVSLATLGARVEPIRVRPALVQRGDTDDPEALAQLLDSTRALTTLPGDRFRILYRLPADPTRYELFLDTKGYYLEWMREAWLAEENLDRAAMMIRDPDRALRVLAPEYKAREDSMEFIFWNSRYARP